MKERPTILYINSFMRSGSSLLGAVLGSHPSIQYMGEARNFQTHILHAKSHFDSSLSRMSYCICGCLMPDCPFWSRVLDMLDTDISAFRTKPGRSAGHKVLQMLLLLNVPPELLAWISRGSSTFRRELETVRNLARLYDTVAAVADKPVICDSSHRSSQAKLLYLHYPDRFRMIHLVRDGRGVVNSLMRRRGCSAGMAARDWKWYSIYALLSLRGIPDHLVLRIRYEDLCTDTLGTLEIVSRFCGIKEWQQAPELVRDAYHLVGGSSTLRQQQEWRIALDERWRYELPKPDQDTFQRIAGRINRLHGYGE